MPLPAHTHAVVESTALITLVGVLAKILPTTASFLAICWYSFVLWEHPVGKRWRQRWRNLFFSLRNRRPLSVEDRVMMVLLGLSSTGFLLVLYAVERVMQ